LNEVSEVCITNNNNYYHLLQWPSWSYGSYIYNQCKQCLIPKVVSSKNSGNCTCIIGKTGENCNESKQCYIEYPIIRRNTNDRDIYRDFVN
jgi:hypothetical protein